MSLCLCVCNAVISESLDLESSFLFTGTSSEYLGQVCVAMLLGQGQGDSCKEGKEACPMPMYGMYPVRGWSERLSLTTTSTVSTTTASVLCMCLQFVLS